MPIKFQPHIHRETDAPIHSSTFLVVEDSLVMRKVITSQLTSLGMTNIIDVENGKDAQKIIEKEHIDLILSDWNMPLMDGLDLLKWVRNHPQHRQLPFIMLTAEAQRNGVEKAIAAGVSDFLVKPYTLNRLERKIRKSLPLSFSTHTETGQDASPAENQDRNTILVVDDAPDNLALIAGLFQNHYRIKLAQNGKKALQICHSDNPPDLVLLDIMLPDVDGFEIAQALRAHPSSEHIPVIFITALADHESWKKGMNLGAIDFISKPIDPEMLRIRVENFLRHVNLLKGLQNDYDRMLEIQHLRALLKEKSAETPAL